MKLKLLTQKRFTIGLVSLSIFITSELVSGQALNPTMYQQAANSSGIVLKTKTAPNDDAVLKEAPSEISLEFPQRVRLVKLTLRNANHDWIDIDFRYSPRVEEAFSWKLPDLAEASYYTADWAILATNEQLVRGTFSFSFGPDAKPPSIEREADELLLQLRYGDPNVRTVRPPATQIIINQDPPQFDPPFTIKLNPDATSAPH